MMKSLVMVLLALVLVACADETTEAMTPPVIETPATTTPVEEPVVESEPEPTPEPEAEVEPDPVMEDPEPEPEPEPVMEEEEDESEAVLPLFNRETLSEFDGRDGRRAYIAIDGMVYDVTNSPRWPNGNHNGFQAGQDLSAQIPRDHRADMRFERFPVVGTYE
jgi:predicted heme/steroid binding protein